LIEQGLTSHQTHYR